MSNLVLNKVQLGKNVDPTDNVTLTTDNAGNVVFNNGNAGTETPVASIGKDGALYCSNIVATGGAISGDRNRVINGSCQIVNVASVAVPNATSGYGGPEMFVATNASAGGQFTQAQGSLTWQGASLPTVRQTVNTAVTSISGVSYWHGLAQRLESFNVFDLKGRPVVVSFVFNTNVSGTYSVSLRDGNTGQSYVSTFVAVANTPRQVSIPISAIPLAANLPNTNETGLSITVGFLNTGAYQTSTLNQWQAGNLISVVGATNWGATAGNFIELTNLQLEEGTVATPFIRRSYQQELALTKRYFQTSYPKGVNPGSVLTSDFFHAIEATCNYASISSALPVEMRVTPTAVVYAPSTGLVGNVSVDGVNTVAQIDATTTSVRVNINNVSKTANQFMAAHYTLAARL